MPRGRATAAADLPSSPTSSPASARPAASFGIARRSPSGAATSSASSSPSTTGTSGSPCAAAGLRWAAGAAAYQQAKEGVRWAKEQGVRATEDDRILLRTAADYIQVVGGDALMKI